MTKPPSDERIRARFQRLRSETEERGVPDFQAMLDRAREDARAPAHGPWPALRTHRRRLLWAGGWTGAAVAAALAAVLLTRDRTDPDAEFERLVSSFATDASAGAWRSPTSALLDVTGADLMRSMPSIGGSLEEGL